MQCSREETMVACSDKASCSRGSEKLADEGYILMVEPPGLANKLEERNQD